MTQDEILIRAFVTGKTKEFLTAHPGWRGTGVEEEKVAGFLQRRAQGEPLAYILGFKEFYGRKFEVTPDTLIPRPETEFLVETGKSLMPKKVLDVGTGSGCIAISLALELPEAEVEAVDVSEKALTVAAKNASALGAKVEFYLSDLLDSVEGDFDLVVANLPYVSRNWDWTGPELKYEPEQALFAEDEGLIVMKRLVGQVSTQARSRYLLLELDPSQRRAMTEFGGKYGFTVAETGVNSEFVLLLECTEKTK